MRLRLSLCTSAVLLLLAWLALTTVGVGGANRFVLQVPATYLSVGQQFQPRLVSLASTAATPADAVAIELLDAGGRRLGGDEISLDGAATMQAAPLDLPRAGAYQLRAVSGAQTQTIALRALPEPSVDYGGVAALANLGMAPGIGDYLRQHGFAVEPLSDATAPGGLPLIVVGDPRLDGTDLAAQYARFWQEVAAGANALVLEPPPPGVAAYWPLAGPLAAPEGNCDADVFDPPLADGLSPDAALADLLRPATVFDLGHETQLDLYHWDGAFLALPNQHRGYPGCHALFSFRYGSGWVTLSTLPLLQHFQDARARLYLMNLIKATTRRKHYQPASPGLAWVMQQRLQKLAQATPDPLATDAVFYRPPPASAESAATLVPAATDGNTQSCWTAPAATEPGASLLLDLQHPQPVRSVTLDFGPGPARVPTAFKIEASPDGRIWTDLPDPAPAANGLMTLPLPAGSWQAVRLTTTAATPAWWVCQFSAR